MTITLSTRGSLIASMIARWYSALEVRHMPGSALASGGIRRSESAHSEIVKSGGGVNKTLPCSQNCVLTSNSVSVMRPMQKT